MTAIAYHCWTWFRIMPKTMPPLIVGGKRVAAEKITACGLARPCARTRSGSGGWSPCWRGVRTSVKRYAPPPRRRLRASRLHVSWSLGKRLHGNRH
ncbi:hypothetical protein LLG90_27470, partial [Aromatoleum toluclasticum]|nr:hypothetical protein [Aromatoleum toluclasticum]